MKALSLRQPYAELIVTGLKTIELRSWNTKHRGKFLVHASKTKAPLSDCKPFDLNPNNLDYGAIIGNVELINVKNYDDYEDSEWQDDSSKHLAGPTYQGSRKGFILKNPNKLAYPIPYKGQLNFFDVDEKILSIGKLGIDINEL